MSWTALGWVTLTVLTVIVLIAVGLAMTIFTPRRSKPSVKKAVSGDSSPDITPTETAETVAKSTDKKHKMLLFVPLVFLVSTAVWAGVEWRCNFIWGPITLGTWMYEHPVQTTFRLLATMAMIAFVYGAWRGARGSKQSWHRRFFGVVATFSAAALLLQLLMWYIGPYPTQGLLRIEEYVRLAVAGWFAEIAANGMPDWSFGDWPMKIILPLGGLAVLWTWAFWSDKKETKK